MRALAVLATADHWTKGHRKADGRAFFAIPGSGGRIYYTDTRDCTCPDRQQRGVDCKHILAVRLWAIEQKAAPAPKGAGSLAAEDAARAALVERELARPIAEIHADATAAARRPDLACALRDCAEPVEVPGLCRYHVERKARLARELGVA